MNVQALVPSWNSAPRKCKDKGKSGEHWARLKRCQDVFAAALTTKHAREAEASSGIPRKHVCSCRAWKVSGAWEERTGKHKLVACLEPWSPGLPSPARAPACPGLTHLRFCSISRMLGPLGETWDHWGQGLKSQVLESGQLQTSSFLHRVVELAQVPDREEGFLCRNPPVGLLSPYRPVEWGSRCWKKTECEQETKQLVWGIWKQLPPPKKNNPPGWSLTRVRDGSPALHPSVRAGHGWRYPRTVVADVKLLGEFSRQRSSIWRTQTEEIRELEDGLRLCRCLGVFCREKGELSW